MTEKVKMLHDIKFATRQRLQFIEVMAYYTGTISRSMLARAYGISDPAATKDLKLYNDLAPGNLDYNPSLFSFVPNPQFDEVFANLQPASVLPMFAQNLLSVDTPSGETPIYGISVEALPFPVRLPEKALLAQIIRSIKSTSQLKISYHSLSKNLDMDRYKDEPDGEYNSENEDNTRIIEPHALVNNGLRWHVRAYNHQSYDFRDFVLSRFVLAEKLDILAESSQHYDDDWMESVSLKLAPHPRLSEKQRRGLSYDYNMRDGMIELQVRRALVGYLLQQMKVDTSVEHSQNPSAYQLIVSNRDEIEPFAGWAFI